MNYEEIVKSLEKFKTFVGEGDGTLVNMHGRVEIWMLTYKHREGEIDETYTAQTPEGNFTWCIVLNDGTQISGLPYGTEIVLRKQNGTLEINKPMGVTVVEKEVFAMDVVKEIYPVC